MAEELLELGTPAELEEQQVEAAEEQPIEAAEEQEPKAEGEHDKTPVTSLFGPDGKRLDPKVSAALTKIKAEAPDLGKLLTKAVYRVAELDREFPGGLTEVRELRDKVEEFGGLAGIQDKLNSLSELDGLSKQFMQADPAFVEDMAASSPEAFAALAPAVFAKFAEVSPEGFGAYVGRVVYGDMQKNSVPLLMMRLGDFLGDNAKAIEVFNQINAYLGVFKTLAENPAPAAPRPAVAETAAKNDSSKREEDLRSREWKIERDTLQKNIVETEYQRALGGRKPDTEEKAQIKELFVSRSTTKATQLFPGWQEKAQRFIRANDKTGYIRYMTSIYNRVVPDAVASAVASTLKGRRTPAAAAAAAVKPVAKQNGTNGAPAAAPGFKPVANEPGSYDVDYSRTDSSMLRQNRAVLRDGSRVTWKG